ncbi:putative transcription initiation factor TFIID [Zancudomyces culisetae]|uniref:Putative transcription initiation factor TFIID n=1 Tax=Zancudomyces culisetae TaxID=1213189 RepID=A0A1R1PGQ2_ZANCU|nr:putative transcription initiation factor TFIID [Zancudomyces culisetae]|eukprot:OMH80156.1 putative transcription initiation factor TFIID [Zancudomyces culisetae]
MFPEYNDAQIRQRLKEFCEFQKKGAGSGYWRAKSNMPVPKEENLREMLSPEMICLFESMLVSQLHLMDLGAAKAASSGAHNDTDSVGNYSYNDPQTPQPTPVNATSWRPVDEASSLAPSSMVHTPTEERLANWNTTRNFTNATQGKAMLQLCGEGDPSNIGCAFSFLRVSMKDIFLRPGEDIETKLAEIESRPKSAHRYNVAEQQEIYREEIDRIWNGQLRLLSSPSSLSLSLSLSPSSSYVPSAVKLITSCKHHCSENENLIVPKSGDPYLPLFLTNNNVNNTNNSNGGKCFEISNLSTNLPLNKPTVPPPHQTSFIGYNSKMLTKKRLVIKRKIRSATIGPSGEYTYSYSVEILTDPQVIEAYLRQKYIIHQQQKENALRDSEAIAKLRLSKHCRAKHYSKLLSSHMSTFSLSSQIQQQQQQQQQHQFSQNASSLNYGYGSANDPNTGSGMTFSTASSGADGAFNTPGSLRADGSFSGSSNHLNSLNVNTSLNTNQNIMPTTPGASTPLSSTGSRRCRNCGMLGHMKSNKKCPRYYEFYPS